MKMNVGQSILVTLWLGVPWQIAAADDAYFHLPLTSQNLAEGAFPATAGASRLGRWQNSAALHPYAVLDGEGEVFIGGESISPWDVLNRLYQNRVIAIRAPKDKEVTGGLFVPKADWSGMIAVKFKLDLTQARAILEREAKTP